MIALSTDAQSIRSQIIFLEYLIPVVQVSSRECRCLPPMFFFEEEISMFWLLPKECLKTSASMDQNREAMTRSGNRLVLISPSQSS